MYVPSVVPGEKDAPDGDELDPDEADVADEADDEEPEPPGTPTAELDPPALPLVVPADDGRDEE